VIQDNLLNLLADSLFALESIGVEEDLCERIRQVLREERPEESPVQHGIWDEMPW